VARIPMYQPKTPIHGGISTTLKKRGLVNLRIADKWTCISRDQNIWTQSLHCKGNNATSSKGGYVEVKTQLVY
jgi:hypothetical protein